MFYTILMLIVLTNLVISTENDYILEIVNDEEDYEIIVKDVEENQVEEEKKRKEKTQDTFYMNNICTQENFKVIEKSNHQDTKLFAMIAFVSVCALLLLWKARQKRAQVLQIKKVLQTNSNWKNGNGILNYDINEFLKQRNAANELKLMMSKICIQFEKREKIQCSLSHCMDMLEKSTITLQLLLDSMKDKHYFPYDEMKLEMKHILDNWKEYTFKWNTIRDGLEKDLGFALIQESWPSICRLVKECKCLRILDEVSKSYENQNRNFNQQCLYVKHKTKLIQVLELAMANRNELELKQAIDMAKSMDCEYIAQTERAMALLDDIVHENSTHEMVKVENDQQLTLACNENTTPSLLSASRAVEKYSDAIQDLRKNGFKQEEAVKLVIKQVYNRENEMIKMEANYRIEAQRILENRRRDMEKYKFQCELAKKDREHQTMLFQNKMLEKQRIAAEQMQLKLDILQKKRDDKTLARKAKAKKELLDKQRIAFEQDWQALIKSDTKWIHIVLYIDLIVFGFIFSILFWDKVQSGIHKSIQYYMIKTCQQERIMTYLPSAVSQMLSWSCQLYYGLQGFGIFILIVMYHQICCMIHMQHIGMIALISILSSYWFGIQWKRILMHLPYLLVSFGFNHFIGYLLRYRKALEWKVKWNIDIRIIFKYMVLPICSIILTSYLSVDILQQNDAYDAKQRLYFSIANLISNLK